MIKATAYIETIGGIRKQQFTIPSPINGFLDETYKDIVKMSIDDAVDDLVKLYGTRVSGQPYVNIRSSGDVWEKDEDEIIIKKKIK